MRPSDAFEMHLHFALMDAAELAHVIGYADFMELFQDTFLRMKSDKTRELTPEEKQHQLDLFNNLEL